MPGTLHVLHVADTHLGYRQYGLIERELDLYDVFSEIVEKAIKERVDAVIHSGDLFDSYTPPPQALRAAYRSLRRLKEAGIPFITVLGDHDTPKRRALPPPVLLEEIGVLRCIGLRGPESARIETRSGVLSVSGLHNLRGIAARQKLLDALSGPAFRPPREEASVLVLHQTLQEAAPEYDVGLGELPKGFSYYALGHIHLTRIWGLGESKVAYPGSPEALRLDEARQRDRYVLLAELAPRRTVSLEKLRLESVRPQLVEEIDYSGIEGAREALHRLREELARLASRGKKPLLHLTVRRVPRQDKPRLHRLAENIVKGVTLAYRMRIDVLEEDLPESLQAPGAVDIHKMLTELLRDKEAVEVAEKLLDILGQGGSHALREAEDWLRKKFGIEG